MLSKEKLAERSMKMIMFAGDARNCIVEVYSFLAKEEYENAKAKIKEAEKLLNEAHHEQTDIVQMEAVDEDVPYSPLFSHAQDTLMVTFSELLTLKNLMPIIEKNGETIEELKKLIKNI